MASLYIPKTEIPVSVGTPPPVLATIPKDPRLLKLINAVHHLPALWRGDLDETNDTEEKRADLWKQVAHQVGAKAEWSMVRNQWENLRAEFGRPKSRPGRPSLPRKYYKEEMRWYEEWVWANAPAPTAADDNPENSQEQIIVEDENNGNNGYHYHKVEGLDPDQPVILQNRYGGEKLEHRGHIYIKHRGDSQTRSIWRCVNYPKIGCKGRIVYTNGEVQQTQLHFAECIPYAAPIKGYNYVKKRKLMQFDEALMDGGGGRGRISFQPAAAGGSSLYGRVKRPVQQLMLDPSGKYYTLAAAGGGGDDYGYEEDLRQQQGQHPYALLAEDYSCSGGGDQQQQEEDEGTTTQQQDSYMGDDGEVNVIDGGVVERDGGEGVQEEKHDPAQQQNSGRGGRVLYHQATSSSLAAVRLAIEHERLVELRLRNKHLGRRLQLEEEKLRLKNGLLQLELQRAKKQLGGGEEGDEQEEKDEEEEQQEEEEVVVDGEVAAARHDGDDELEQQEEDEGEVQRRGQ